MLSMVLDQMRECAWLRFDFSDWTEVSATDVPVELGDIDMKEDAPASWNGEESFVAASASAMTLSTGMMQLVVVNQSVNQ